MYISPRYSFSRSYFSKPLYKALKDLPDQFQTNFPNFESFFHPYFQAPSLSHPSQNLDLALKFWFPVTIPQKILSRTKNQWNFHPDWKKSDSLSSTQEYRE